MASFNRIILLGNLTRDPQLSYTSGNLAVCKFGMAMNNRWRDKEGKDREDVCFVDCTVFGRAGETFNQYMKKGRTVFVEGRLHLNQWTTPEGEKRSKLEVVVENFQFVGGRPGDGSSGAGDGGSSGAPAGASRGGGPSPSGPDDIPF